MIDLSTQRKPKPPARSSTMLTAYGYWYAMRLRLLARLGDRCKVETDSPEFNAPTVEAMEY